MLALGQVMLFERVFFSISLGDGYFPFLSSVETARNRKRCKFLLQRLRAHNKGG
jgi:hypothetical protein